MYTIGIDIGGTHTDAVLLDASGKTAAWAKGTTTHPLTDGVKGIIQNVLQQANLCSACIKTVIMGTTHATNAILEGSQLLKVGLIRISDAKPLSPSPGFGWPRTLQKQVIGATQVIDGGYECDARGSRRFSLIQARDAIEKLLDAGVEAISIVGAFAPLNGEQERLIGCLVKELAGSDFPVSFSHEIGGIGLIERENATLLNSALKKVIVQGFAQLEQILQDLNICASVWLTQNNGSLLSLAEARLFPIKTIGAGPTNSFIGASRLCGLDEAIVVDVGGTSTDIGLIEGGYARSSLQAATIGGIPLHFAMPDMISLALGGGSLIKNWEAGDIQIGPNSVARYLKMSSQVFGGSILTLTDAAVAAGHFSVSGGMPSKIVLKQDQAQTVIRHVCKQVYQSIKVIQGKRKGVPVIVVGGGASLLQPLFEAFELEGIIPERAGIANAYGAGLAEVSGVIDSVVSLKEREAVLDGLKNQAIQAAIKKGADASQIRIASLSILPFAYTTDALAKVLVTASGPRLEV